MRGEQDVRPVFFILHPPSPLARASNNLHSSIHGALSNALGKFHSPRRETITCNRNKGFTASPSYGPRSVFFLGFAICYSCSGIIEGNRTEVLVSVTDGNRLGAKALMDALSSSAERVDVESGVWLVGGGLGVAPFPDDWAEPMESGGGPEEVERALAWIRLQSVGLSDGMKPFLPSGTPTRTGLPGWAARMDHILVSREGVDVVSAKVVGAIGERRSSTLLLEWERSARDATFQV